MNLQDLHIQYVQPLCTRISCILQLSSDFTLLTKFISIQKSTLLIKKPAIICPVLLAPFAGAMCPFRHISGEKTVVCKHWLRGLCKKGDQCEFLHEYDMTKMPECYFYSKFGLLILHFPFKSDCICTVEILLIFNVCVAGECSNKECPFLHIDPESKIKDCPWYDRGFCKHGKCCSVMILSFYQLLHAKNEIWCVFLFSGPDCRHRHTRRVICVSYLVGFCPEGKSCKFMQYVFI